MRSRAADSVYQGLRLACSVTAPARQLFFYQVTLTVTAGTLSMGSVAELTFITGSGDSGATLSAERASPASDVLRDSHAQAAAASILALLCRSYALRPTSAWMHHNATLGNPLLHPSHT